MSCFLLAVPVDGGAELLRFVPDLAWVLVLDLFGWCDALHGRGAFSTDTIDLLLVRACCRGVVVVCAVSKGSKYWEMGVAIVCGCRGGRGGCA